MFDIDDTLVDHQTAADTAVSGWIADAGFPTITNGTPTSELWFDIGEAAFADYFAGRSSFQQQRRTRVAQFFTAIGQDASHMSAKDLDGQFDEYRRRYRDAWRPLPDVVPTLERLSPLARLAVLSNGDLHQQTEKLRATGLDHYFEHILTSSGLGVAKPDPLIFDRAVRMLGAAPGEVAYCGDRLDIDAQAASAAGLAGVWLNRNGRVVTGLDVQVVTSIAELPSLLGM